MSVAEVALAPLEQPQPTGAGPRLKEARESAGLQVQDIAARLRLDPGTIEALENEEYAKLHGPTFVRGYLRGYARALDLPPGPIMEAYDRRGDQPPALVADISSGSEEARSSDPLMRLVTLGIVVALVGLVAAWWSSQSEIPAESEPFVLEETLPGSRVVPIEQSPTTETVAPPPVLAPASESAAVVPLPEAQPEGPAAESLVPAIPESAVAETESAAAVESVPPDATTAPAEAVAPAESVEPPASLQSSELPEVVPSEPAAQQEVPAAVTPQVAATAAATGDNNLVLQFEHESWVEVYAADGSRMYYNLVRPGQVLDLTGAAPIKVLLGYARGVRVQYNGRPFDHRPFMSKGLARFTLGGTAVPSAGE